MGRGLWDLPACAVAWRQGNEEAQERSDSGRSDPQQAIVDAYGAEERAMGWYYYLENQLRFPFQARCTVSKVVSPLSKGETVQILRMAPEDSMLRRHARADPLARPEIGGASVPTGRIESDESTAKPSATGITGSRRATFSDA